MAQVPCKRARLATSSDLGTSSRISEDMDVTTENRSVEVQGAGAQGPEENGQCNSGNRRCLIESEQFVKLLRHSSAFVDKTLFIKQFFLDVSTNMEYEDEPMARMILITAPNRFGKSVNMNTLKVFAETQVDESGNIVTCLKKNAAGKLIEDRNKTPPNSYTLFKTINRTTPLKIYDCYCSTKHMGDDLENGTCESRQFFYRHCGQHPVIFMSLKSILCNNWNQFICELKESLCDAYKQHMYLGDKRSHLPEKAKVNFNLFCWGQKCVMNKEGEPITLELDENDLLYALQNLVEYLYIHFGKEVLILIDEFDAPLMQLLHGPNSIELDYIQKIVQYIGVMVSNVLKGNNKVFGALVNACVLLATTVLPYANNLSVCSFLEDHRFSQYYGFTKAEVANLLTMRPFEGFHETDILSYYNGYRVLGTDIELYSTFSVLAYLDAWKDKWEREKREAGKSPDKKKHRPTCYWSRNHGISSLNKLFAIEGVRKKLSDAITNDSVVIWDPVFKMTPEHILTLKKVMSQPAKVDEEYADLFLQYMRDRGYFNINEKSEAQCVLALPNGEIKDEIKRQFYDASYYRTKYNIAAVAIDKYGKAINDLDHHNNESFQKLSDSIASLLSGDMKPKNHHDEIKGALYTFARCAGNLEDASCEPLCQDGRKYRCDLLMIRKDGTGIIIEVKWSKDTARAGLKQIFNNEYYKAFERYNITKDKIYIGLHMNDRKVTICAFATSNDKVVEKFINISKKELIVKCSKLS